MNVERFVRLAITVALSNAALYLGFYGPDNPILLFGGLFAMVAAVVVVVMLMSYRQKAARRHPRESKPVVPPRPISTAPRGKPPRPLAASAIPGSDQAGVRESHGAAKNSDNRNHRDGRAAG